MLVVKVGSVVDDFIDPDGRYTEREGGRGEVMLVVMVGSVVDDFIYLDGRYTEREVGKRWGDVGCEGLWYHRCFH